MPALAKTKAPSKAGVAAETMDAKRAVSIATNYFREFFLPQLTKPNVMLEELEEANDGSSWMVTLGYDMPNRVAKDLDFLKVQGGPARAYKIFTIERKTGRVKSVKIRNV